MKNEKKKLPLAALLVVTSCIIRLERTMKLLLQSQNTHLLHYLSVVRMNSLPLLTFQSTPFALLLNVPSLGLQLTAHSLLITSTPRIYFTL